MFGADDKHHEGPPAYSAGPSLTTLSDTSHNVTLTVPTPSNGYFIPGSQIDASLGIPSDVLGGIVGDVEVRLEGKSSVEIMGKSRYQVCAPSFRFRLGEVRRRVSEARTLER